MTASFYVGLICTGVPVLDIANNERIIPEEIWDGLEIEDAVIKMHPMKMEIQKLKPVDTITQNVLNEKNNSKTSSFNITHNKEHQIKTGLIFDQIDDDSSIAKKARLRNLLSKNILNSSRSKSENNNGSIIDHMQHSGISFDDNISRNNLTTSCYKSDDENYNNNCHKNVLLRNKKLPEPNNVDDEIPVWNYSPDKVNPCVNLNKSFESFNISNFDSSFDKKKNTRTNQLYELALQKKKWREIVSKESKVENEKKELIECTFQPTIHTSKTATTPLRNKTSKSRSHTPVTPRELRGFENSIVRLRTANVQRRIDNLIKSEREPSHVYKSLHDSKNREAFYVQRFIENEERKRNCVLHAKPFDHVGKKNKKEWLRNTKVLEKGQFVTCLNILVGGGKSGKISLYENDNPFEIVSRFSKVFGKALSDEAKSKLHEVIVSHINSFHANK